MAKRTLFLALCLLPLLVGCAASPEVKPEQIDSYQNAGLKPGEKAVKATAGAQGP